MRINGFEQIKAFYSIVFQQEFDFKPQHISLYIFLLNQNNRNNWVEWFKCPYDLGMTGSCIGSKKTYYACLDDLQNWGLIKYQKGENAWKSPKIKLEVLKSTSTDTATIPQSEPLPIPVVEPVPIPLPTHNIKPITSNLKPLTIEDRKLKFATYVNPFELKYGKEMIVEFFEYWTELNPSKTKMRFEGQKFFDVTKRLATWHSRKKDSFAPIPTNQKISFQK